MKPSVKFGLFAGLLSGLWLLSFFTLVGWVNHLFHLDVPAWRIRAYSGLFSILILVLGIFLGMRESKRRNGYQITYSEAVKTGVITSVIIGILVALFSLLYCTVINPNFSTYMANEAQKAMIAAHDPPETISRQLEQIKKEFSASSQVLMALTGQPCDYDAQVRDRATRQTGVL